MNTLALQTVRASETRPRLCTGLIVMCTLDPRRTKRTVQYNNPEDVWQYIGGGKRLPSAYPKSNYTTIQRTLHSSVVVLVDTYAAQRSNTRGTCPVKILLRSNSTCFQPSQELQADMARQQRVLANVALIEARDRVERAEILRLETAALFDHGTKALPTPGAERKPLEEPQLATNEAPDPPRPQQKNPLPKMATDSFEPQTWTPRARTRVNDS